MPFSADEFMHDLRIILKDRGWGEPFLEQAASKLSDGFGFPSGMMAYGSTESSYVTIEVLCGDERYMPDKCWVNGRFRIMRDERRILTEGAFSSVCPGRSIEDTADYVDLFKFVLNIA